VWTNNLVSFLFGVGLYSVMAFLPEFLQTSRSAGYGFGASTVVSGLYLLPMTFGMFILGLYSGKIAAKYGSKFAVILGSAVSCVGYIVLAFAHDESWEIYLASACLGVGLGLAFSAMSNLIVVAVPPAQTGVASGMNANIRTIGGAVGAGVTSSIVTSTLLKSGVPAESGYVHGFLFLAVVTVFAVVAAILIPTAVPDGQVHLAHAELAIVPGGTITEG
jgi:MFS family permease